MKRLRRRRLVNRLRANMRALGHPEVDQLSDEAIAAMPAKFGMTLKQAVLLSDPSVKLAREFDGAMHRMKEVASLSREDIRAAADEVRQLAEQAPIRSETHDGAGELLLLRGGPMDGYLVRDGAPVLFPGWSKDGAYTRAGPEPDRDEDGTEVATWTTS